MASPVPAWLPNAISFARILLVPVWVYSAERANQAAAAAGDALRERLTAAGILILIGLSDVVDGWLARRFRLQSKLGATLDAVADKLTQVVSFTYLALRTGPAFPPVPTWFLTLLIARDALLLAGYAAIRRRHGVVDTAHLAHGKASSLLLFALLVALSAGAPSRVVLPLLGLAAAMTTASTMLYVRRGVREWRRADVLPRQTQ